MSAKAPGPRPGRNDFPQRVGRREKRRLARDRDDKPAMWWGLSAIGAVGWIVALPTLAGGFAGLWLDRAHPQRFSWTLMLVLIGLMAGCAAAWLWVRRQRLTILDRHPGRDDA